MLSLSAAQMDRFGAAARERFISRMADHLRGKFSDRAASLADDQLHELIRLGMAQARMHGVEFEDDIRRYLEYMAIYGMPLDQRPQAPWLAEILHDDSHSGSRKMDLIGEYELRLLRSRR